MLERREIANRMEKGTTQNSSCSLAALSLQTSGGKGLGTRAGISLSLSVCLCVIIQSHTLKTALWRQKPLVALYIVYTFPKIFICTFNGFNANKISSYLCFYGFVYTKTAQMLHIYGLVCPQSFVPIFEAKNVVCCFGKHNKIASYVSLSVSRIFR